MAIGKVYDIMNRLTNVKPVIKIDETHEYEVHNSKNTVIFIKQVSEDKSIDDFKRIDTIIESALGKDALDYINNLDLSMAANTTVINAIMAAISEVELEEVEEEAKKQQKKFRK